MKRKWFFVFVVMMAFCGIFTGVNVTPFFAQASSPTSSVWQGTLQDGAYGFEENGSFQQLSTSPAATGNSNVAFSDFYSEGNTYYIYSAKGLAHFANTVNAGTLYAGCTVFLETDITWQGNFLTIGNSTNTFNGTFNGNGHSIFDINLLSNENCVGFFGVLGTAGKVQNLHIRNLNLVASAMELSNSSIGGLVGISNGQIANCSVKGKIKAELASANVGGLVGVANFGISNSFAQVEIFHGANSNVGGLAGSARSAISNSYVQGEISSSNSGASNVGGIVGQTEGIFVIENCHNSASLLSRSAAGTSLGGLVGKSTGAVTINNSFNAGNISYVSAQGNAYAGILGNATASARISQVFNVGALALEDGIVASTNQIANGSNINKTEAYFENEISNLALGAVPNLSLLAKTKDFYENGQYFSTAWNFSSVWKIAAGVNGGFPHLALSPTNSDGGNTFDKETDIKLRGEGTAANPFLIETAGDLAYVATLYNSILSGDNNTVYHFSLQNNINLFGRTWVPIAYQGISFNGVFDGNNHTISGMMCSIQENMANHGLFGKTSGAVIKNLKIADVKFLVNENPNNDTTHSTGTLIGTAADTYLINCVDESNFAGTDGKLVQTVGKTSGQLFVAYGKNNISANGTINERQGLHLNDISFEKAFDVTISANGGMFYDSTDGKTLAGENTYLAEYHLLFDENGNVLSTIDTTFGKTIPQLSTEIGKADVLIRRGFKLVGFKYAWSNSNVQLSAQKTQIENFVEGSGNTIRCQAVAGLVPVWQEETVAVKVIYNQYERANFGATRTAKDYGSFETEDGTFDIEVGDNGQVYIVFDVPYDTQLSQHPYIFSTPVSLRGQNFAVDSIWTSFAGKDFSNQLVATETLLINDNFSYSELYAKWKGEGTNGNLVTLKFVTDDNMIDDLSKVVVQDGINGGGIKQGDEDATSLDKMVVGYNHSDNSFSVDFAFDSSFGASMSEWLNFEYQLALGFVVDEATLMQTSTLDSNFGIPTSVGENNSGAYQLSAKNGKIDNNLYNLSGSYTITLKVIRAQYSDTLTLQGQHFFGIGPKQNLKVFKAEGLDKFSSNAQLYVREVLPNGNTRDVWKDLVDLDGMDSTILKHLAEQTNNIEQAANLFVTFDMPNNKILFSSSVFDAQSFAFENELQFKIDNNSFLLQKTESGVVLKQVFDEIKTNVLLEVNNKSNKMFYPAKNSFVIVASTEDENVIFSNADYVTTNSGGQSGQFVDEAGEVNANNPAIAKPKLSDDKFVFVYDKVIKQSDLENNLRIVTKYTRAVFDFAYAYEGLRETLEDGLPANFAALSPNVSFATDGGKFAPENFQGQIDVAEDKNVILYVQASDFFKFFGQIGAKLFDGQGNSFNIKIAVDSANVQNPTEENDNEKYQEDFNANNTMFFDSANASAQLFHKGELTGLEDGSRFAQDTYKISLPFFTNLLQFGHYTVSLLCTDVLYDIAFDTAFTFAEDVAGKTDAQIADAILQNNNRPENGGIRFDTQSDSGIETKVNVDGAEYVSGTSSILFDSQVLMGTNLAGNKAYEFYGWFLQSEQQTNIVKEKEVARIFESLYMKDENITAGSKIPYDKQIVAKAIYVKKQFKLQISEVIIANRNGEGDFRAKPENLRLSLAMATEAGQYEYDYSCLDSSVPEDVTISLSGVNAAGYCFEGYEIVDGSGTRLHLVSKLLPQDGTISLTPNLASMTISMRWLKQLMQNGVAVSGNSQTYFILPILKQKTVQISLHSGAQANEFNANGKAGHVFDNLGNETTNNVYQLNETIYFGQTFDISALHSYLLNGVQLEAEIDSLFASRTGYSSKNLYRWWWKMSGKMENLSDMLLVLESKLFAVEENSAQIHLFLDWNPNTYAASFDKNDKGADNTQFFGTASGQTASMNGIVYDSPTKLGESGFTFRGYEFVGWSLNASTNTAIEVSSIAEISEAGIYKIGNEFFAFNLTPVQNESVLVYAMWRAKAFRVAFNLNGGNYVGNALEQEGENFVATITYHTAFSSIALQSIVPQRTGFNFAGFHILDSFGNSQAITNETLFNAGLLGLTQDSFVDYVFGEEIPIVLTLYAAWDYVSNFAALSLPNNLISLTFDGKTQLVRVCDFFFDELNNAQFSAANLTLQNQGGVLMLSTSAQEVTIVNQTTPLVGTIDVSEQSISVKNTGEYIVTFSIVLSDNAQWFNRGQLQTITLYLNIKVNAATLEIKPNEAILVSNAKKIMQPFVKLEENAFSTLMGLTEFMMALEGEESFKNLNAQNAHQEIYDYVITKYFLLFSSDDGQNHKTFKQWTFDNFVAYRTQNAAQVNEILQNMQYFTFYAFPKHNQTDGVTNEYLPLLEFETENAPVSVSSDILKVRVQLFTNSQAIQAQNAYQLRLYVQSTENVLLGNYALSQDGAEYFLTIGKAFVLPMPFVAKNASNNNSTFFSSAYSDYRVVQWNFAYDGEIVLNPEDESFFKIAEIDGNPLYAAANLLTSNVGQSDADVTFSFKALDNFLYFSDVSVKLVTNAGQQDYTSNFKFVLEDDTFTIKSVSEVVHLNLFAKYLTVVDETQYCDKVNSQNANLQGVEIPQDLLRIESVSYNLEDGKGEVWVETTENRFFADGTLVYEILLNNANENEIYLSPVVKKIAFSASPKIGQLISLYKWQAGEYLLQGVDDGMAEENFVLSLQDAETYIGTDGALQANLNAIYTDLVNVKFNFNFPNETGFLHETFVKLGSTTKETFPFPQQSGLVCAQVALVGSGLDLMNDEACQSFFAGEGQTYVGLQSVGNRTPLRFDVRWQIAPLQGTQVLVSNDMPVSSFEGLLATDVLRVSSLNSNLFDITYKWEKLSGDEYVLISSLQQLLLPNLGSVSESGQYRLQISANLKDEYLSCLVANAQTSSQLQANFTLNFMANILESVSQVGSFETTYDNLNHMQDWKVEIAYKMFDEILKGYAEEAQTVQLGYVEDGDLYFEVFYNNNLTERVSEMKNAGTYTIFVRFKADKFQFPENFEEVSFTYTILPMRLDLQSEQFNFNKQKPFNGNEIVLDLQHTINNEVLTISAVRATGEDVGTYDIFLAENQNTNYCFAFGQTMLYENGNLLPAAATTAIGSFQIVQSGILRLEYAGDVVSQTYKVGGFHLALSQAENGQIQLLILDEDGNVILDEDGNAKPLELSLIDVSKGEAISSEEILQILLPKFLAINAKFSTANGKAEDCGTYYYAFETTAEFEKYFASVQIVETFNFQILPYIIDVEALEQANIFQKVFDGNKNLIVSVPGFEGIEIEATFFSHHVGQAIPISLSLQGSGLKQSNFTLSKLSSLGNITPREATLTLSLSQENFVYGQVSTDNLSSFISVQSLEADGTQMTLEEGYYSLNFVLNNAATNDKNFIFAGTYQVDCSACQFDDFVMTINPLSLQIVPCEILVEVPDNFFTITTTDVLQAVYSKELTNFATGDQFSLDFSVEYSAADLVDGKLKEGKYSIALVGAVDGKIIKHFGAQDTLGSAVISLATKEDGSANTGFAVVDVEKPLFVTIADESILQQTYCGKNFSLSIAKDKTLQVLKDGIVVAESALQFSDDAAFEFESVSISNAANENFKNVGIYSLALEATVEGGVFDFVNFTKAYNFQITAQTIDVSVLKVEKTFDGTSLATISAEELEKQNLIVFGDDVQVLARFENANVGNAKTANLSLQGADAGNYELSEKTTANAKILQAKATIFFKSDVSTSFTYGQITNVNSILSDCFVIKDESNNLVSSAQFTLQVSLVAQESDFSALGYLKAKEGSYAVQVSCSSTNYAIDSQTFEIFVNRLSFALNFKQPGVIKLEKDAYASTLNVPYSCTTDLGELVSFTLQRESTAQENGCFRLVSGNFESADKNYVATVSDSVGAVELVASSQQIFVLFTENQQGTNNALDIPQADIEYDGNLYDGARVELFEGKPRLVVYSTKDFSISKTFDLDFFTLQNGQYVRFEKEVEGFSTNIQFMHPNNVKNVGVHQLVASETTSANFSNIRLGKQNASHAFNLKIVPKQLFFKQNTEDDEKTIQNGVLVQTFNNKPADYVFEDASLLLDGIVSGEKLALNVKFMDGANLAKYVRIGYAVAATLLDGQNYQLNLSTKAPDGSAGKAITGTITYARVTLIINSQSFTYGQLPMEDGKIDIKFLQYAFDMGIDGFDMDAYLADGRTFDAKIEIAGLSTSTSGNLNVGEYSFTLSLVSSDFVAGTYIVNNQPREDLSTAKLTIVKKQLSIVQTDTPLSEVFHKRYDGNAEVNIFDAGMLRFDLQGILAKDVVNVVSAAFAKDVGQNLDISFVLGGADAANYGITLDLKGQIDSVKVDIKFNYEKTTSGADLSQLDFPFINQARLDFNASASSTKNFPSTIVAPVGKRFSHWSMDFEVSTQDQREFLQDNVLAANLSYSGTQFSVRVGNDAATVKFLAALLQDELDVFGKYSFAKHQSILVEFNPNFNILQHELRLQLADENGTRNSTLGSVIVLVDGNEVATETDRLAENFNHGSTVVVKAVANENCLIDGFYVGTAKFEGNENISIEKTSQGMVLTINSFNENQNFVVRFKMQKVKLVLDLSENENAEFNSSNFVSIGKDKFAWTTTFNNIKDKNLTILPEISLYGHNFVGFKVNENTILSEAFATTQILNLLQMDAQQEELSLTFAPVFEAVDVALVLDFGYDGKTQSGIVKFGSAFETASIWQENPTRVGKNFSGWWKDGVRITGKSIVTSQDAQILTAKWDLTHHSLTLLANNATISDASVNFETPAPNTYVFAKLEYGSTLTFKVLPQQGFVLDTAWPSTFEVALLPEGGARVTFTVPDEDVSFAIPTLAKENVVSLHGQNVASFEAYDITVSQTENTQNSLDIIDGKLRIATGRKLRLKASPQEGFEISLTLQLDGHNLLPETESFDGMKIARKLENGTLIVEIEGICKDISVGFVATEKTNKIMLNFTNPASIESVVALGVTYSNLAQLPAFDVRTGHNFQFYVKFNFGFQLALASSDDFFVRQIENTDEGLQEYLKFEISSVHSSGSVEISSKRSLFTLRVQVVSFDASGQIVEIADNKAFVDGTEGEKQVEFQQVAILSMQEAPKFSFAGWFDSLEGAAIETAANFAVQVENNRTIYAVFSASKNEVKLGSLCFNKIFTEADGETSLLKEVSAGWFADANGQPIESVQMFYGAPINFVFNVPEGFMFYGFAYMLDGQYVIKENRDASTQVSVTISSAELDNNIVEKIWVVLTPYSLELEVSCKINIDGAIFADENVGSIQLVSEAGGAVNSFGYVEGTGVHLVGESTSKQFNVLAHTGESVFVKTSVQRAGYVFAGVWTNNNALSVDLLSQNENFAIYKISGIVGGGNKVLVEAYFKPTLNFVDLSFLCDEVQVDGGAFDVLDTNIVPKVWTSGKDYAAVMVSAYTDSTFAVTAYVRAGYLAENAQILDEAGVVVPGSVRYQALSIQKTGYSGKITFVVENFFKQNSIKVVLKPQTYTVNFKDGFTTLLTIENVKFGSMLDISIENAQNIHIHDNSIRFVADKLNLVLKKSQFNYVGFFTKQNGAGAQYINSVGEVCNSWTENGFEYDTTTNLFKLCDNAKQNEDGSIEIDLFEYQSYLKTRIHFQLFPSINGVTAQNMITGVDITNSWFYESNQHYIEVAYGTDIYITAPEIEGYEFFNFVIKQKTADGTWLSDVSSNATKVPWSTNEFDNIVEVQVIVTYFARVQVSVVGGAATFAISQAGSDNPRAAELLAKGFVDTSKPFSIEAIEGEGYNFKFWKDLETGQIRNTKTISLSPRKGASLQIWMEGKPVTLDFAAYDAKNGQIVKMQTISADGVFGEVSLGAYRGTTFVKNPMFVRAKVGDKITFVVAVDFGFATIWNRQDVVFDKYANGHYYFCMEILPSEAEGTSKIIPTFKDEILSVFVNTHLKASDVLENAFDGNAASLAGKITFEGQIKTFFTTSNEKALKLEIVCNNRYGISRIVLQSYGRVFDNMAEFLTADGNILLSLDFLQQNNIVGTLSIDVEFERLMWQAVSEEIQLQGSGTAKDPYRISNAQQLALVMQLCNGGLTNSQGVLFKDCAYVLTANINLSDKFWTPIGTQEFPFNGRFDFNNHLVEGIYTAQIFQFTSHNGLFGVLGKNAVIVAGTHSLWWIYLIVATVVFLVLVLVWANLANRKRKKQHEELAKR